MNNLTTDLIDMLHILVKLHNGKLITYDQLTAVSNELMDTLKATLSHDAWLTLSHDSWLTIHYGMLENRGNKDNSFLNII